MTSEEKLAASIDADIELKQTQIGKYLINYAKAGSGPPMVLIHSSSIGWAEWYLNIPDLSRYFTVYAIDLPGSGRASYLDYDEMNPVNDLVDTTERFIIKLGLQKVVLVGSSFGGWVAARLASQNPAFLKKLILVSPAGLSSYIRPLDIVFSWHWFAHLVSNTIFNFKHTNSKSWRLKKYLSLPFHKETKLGDDFLDLVIKSCNRQHKSVHTAALLRKLLDGTLNLESQLSRIKVQTLLIWGDRNPFIPFEKIRNSIELINNLDLKIVQEGGHILNLEHPDVLNKYMLNFAT